MDRLVGSNIQRYRNAKGMSQTDLASALGGRLGENIHQQTIQKIEKGTRPIRFVEALNICRLLDIELDNLAAGKDTAGQTADQIRTAHQLEEMRAVLLERGDRISRATVEYLLAQENFRKLVDVVRRDIVPTAIEDDTFESRGTAADELALAVRDIARDPHEFCDAGQDRFDKYASQRSEDRS